MKKNFKFLLVALFAVFGFNSAWAAIDDEFDAGNYRFQITKEANANKIGGTVQILGLTEAVKINRNQNGVEPYISNGVLEFPGTATNNGITYSVTTMAPETFKDVAYYATKVTIPASLTEIPEAAFNTLTNLSTIVFAENSQVKRIGKQAFSSTRITEFDFTNCVLLEGLDDEVFVERSMDQTNENKNSFITKVTVPTSPQFKHINGAFRNLTELTEIVNLENSWIQEITASAFKGTKLGTTEAKPLVLPEKDLLYIDKNALKGSEVKYLEIKMGSLLNVGGCTVTYEPNTNTDDDNYGAYEYTYNTSEVAEENLYGLSSTGTAAPLVSLKLTGTQKGKICKYAFAWCKDLDGLDLTGLFYGSKAQFETSSFEGCTKITELVINPIENNETEGYTFEEDAFTKTPVATLTIKSVGTAKAVNKGAFGSSLKKVTIGTVDATGANAKAFAESAFIFDKVSGNTLLLATGDGEYLNSKDATNAIIAGKAFDFSAIYGLETIASDFKFPVVKIGEIKSKGAVFATGALYGPVKEIEFTGKIERNGLTIGGSDTGTNAGVKILSEGTFTATSYANVTSVFTTLTFDGEIGTNGIGSGAFANFTALTSVTFNGLLAELAVASGSFTGSGKVTSDYIGTKDAPFVKYTVSNIDNWAVNPFATDAFGEDNTLDERIIWWSIADENLKEEISYAIHKAVADADDAIEYELDKTYNTKFNVYKWVDILYVEPEDEVPSILFFQDLENNNKIAWGRYDLGSFIKEKGKYAISTTDASTGDITWENAYEATNMVIPRIQETTGAKVKLTLYGVYYDEDDFSRQSTTYLVPLRLVNGTYQIPSTNDHLIIGKAEVQEGSFTNKDVKIYYNNKVDLDDNDEPKAWYWKGLAEVEYNEANDAVWSELRSEARVYEKAAEGDVKTHQELWDVVKRYDGSSVDRAGKNLWVMLDPAKYAGFGIDSNPITKDNYTFIGLNWYYVLLKNYGVSTASARVIWLNDDQATAIFGVKQDAATKKNYVVDDAIYNLQGVRVSPFALQKGQIYIQGGKKFINK